MPCWPSTALVRPHNPRMDWQAARVSFWLAALTACILLPLGVGLARWLALTPSRWRPFVEALLMLPLLLPPTVLGYYLLVLLGRNGWLGQWLQDTWGINLIFSLPGAVIAATVVAVPLVFKPARAACEAIDGQMEEAGRVLGVSEIGIFLRITLPLAWRGILAGVLLGFPRALGESGATRMVAGSTPRTGPTMRSR